MQEYDFNEKIDKIISEISEIGRCEAIIEKLNSIKEDWDSRISSVEEEIENEWKHTCFY